MPDGSTRNQKHLLLDPIVTITDAAGKKIAQGPMPFG